MNRVFIMGVSSDINLFSRSPGQYCCKNSSRSGALAAQKLVQGRRKFQDVITNELLGDDDVNDDKEKDPVRKIYTLIGHGVPNSLFEHFISTGREWLNCQNSMMSSTKAKHFAKPVLPRTPPQKTNSAVHLSLRNIPNCTILDRERILKTNASGTTSLIQWPPEWDHDLELFMVAMNRIGSRLSSIVMKPDTHTPTELVTGDAAAGSVIIPSDLDKWNVSIRKGEVLPFSMLPLSQQDNTLVLTVEWLRNSPDCWTIILRLQDDFIDSNAAAKGLIRDPISLVFEGVYVTP